MGISCGLFSQSYWEMFRHYYINIERSALTDKKMAQNIKISFQIYSLVATDILNSDVSNIDIVKLILNLQMKESVYIC